MNGVAPYAPAVMGMIALAFMWLGIFSIRRDQLRRRRERERQVSPAE